MDNKYGMPLSTNNDLKTKRNSHSVTCHGTVVILGVPITNYPDYYGAESAINKHGVFLLRIRQCERSILCFAPFSSLPACFKLQTPCVVVSRARTIYSSF